MWCDVEEFDRSGVSPTPLVHHRSLHGILKGKGDMQTYETTGSSALGTS